MKDRIVQLDYLKGIFILLMVAFHISLIETTYPTLRSAVYTFHMSAFLIISGYLANVNKNANDFFRGLMRLIVPYVLFEIVYVVMLYFMSSILHTSNTMESIGVLVIVNKILAHPSGPYWYLHTLIICTFVYYFVYRVLRQGNVTAFILTGLILYGLYRVGAGILWGNAMYFLIGVYIARSGRSLLEAIPPSFVALLPLCVLFASSDNFSRASLAGIAITVLVISFLLSVYPHCSNGIQRFFRYLGCNSLSIVVFSPIFTSSLKVVSPMFKFDPTAICFGVFAVGVTIACCLFCAWLSDKLRISRFVFCKESIYTSF